jgi:SAM-dependent methyltransferase
VTLYDSEFLSNLTDGSTAAARLLLPIVFETIGVPASIVDVGCGTGAWSATALEMGVESIVVTDGQYARSSLIVSPECFVPSDLATSIAVRGRFDLVICIEVAEHLPAPRATSFVSDLCELSDAVLFSAAIPGQAGVGHINLRWQSYWCSLFAVHGFSPDDLARRALWETSGDFWIIAQNAFLYRKNNGGHNVDLLDIAHPRHVESLLANKGVRESARELGNALWAKARKSAGH